MLLKPVSALALSAFVSLFASSAVAAPAPSSDAKLLESPAKTLHHGKKDSKPKKKKPAHLAMVHSAEPRTSPKLAASLSSPLDIKKASDKGAPAKKGAVSASGKEVFIGGPVAHGSGYKHSTSGGLLKGSASVSAHGAMGGGHASNVSLKSGREPSHAKSVAKAEVAESGLDEHPPQALIATGGATLVGTEGVSDGKLVVASTVKVDPKTPCLHEPVELTRGTDTESFALTSCSGAVAPLADERFSVMLRPESAALPSSIPALAKVKGPQLAPGIRRVDRGLVERLQLVANHFAKPGTPTRISVVSGYRPSSPGSFHATAQALDFRVDGVTNEALVEFCKTLEDTGCGYYPNSSFVHIDVRAPKTGHVAWIDASGPGESPRYVAAWPPAPEPDVKVAKEDDDTTKPDALPPLPSDTVSTTPDEDRTPAASMSEPFHVKDWE